MLLINKKKIYLGIPNKVNMLHRVCRVSKIENNSAKLFFNNKIN